MSGTSEPKARRPLLKEGGTFNGDRGRLDYRGMGTSWVGVRCLSAQFAHLAGAAAVLAVGDAEGEGDAALLQDLVAALVLRIDAAVEFDVHSAQRACPAEAVVGDVELAGAEGVFLALGVLYPRAEFDAAGRGVRLALPDVVAGDREDVEAPDALRRAVAFPVSAVRGRVGRWLGIAGRILVGRAFLGRVLRRTFAVSPARGRRQRQQQSREHDQQEFETTCDHRDATLPLPRGEPPASLPERYEKRMRRYSPPHAHTLTSLSTPGATGMFAEPADATEPARPP